MKPTKLFLTLAVAVLLGACANQEKGKKHCRIEGTVADSTYTMMLLAPSGSDFRVAESDSIPVIDGKFAFDLYVDEVMPYDLISMEEHIRGTYYPCVFFPEEGSINVTFYHLEKDDKQPTVISNGPINKRYQQYDEELNRRLAPLLQENDSLINIEQWDSPRMDELNTMFRATMNKCTEEYIRSDQSIVGLFLLLRKALWMGHSEADDSLSIALYNEIYQPLFPNHPLSKQIEAWIESRGIKVGGRYIDFTAPDLNGTPHTLSEEIAGKIALIDLWASWCGSCRGTSKSMIPLYEKYKERGFTVVGVAREDKRENMERALAKDGYPWLNLLELRDENKIWSKYGVDYAGGITVLVDRDGTILAIHPTAEEVERILQEKL